MYHQDFEIRVFLRIPPCIMQAAWGFAKDGFIQQTETTHKGHKTTIAIITGLQRRHHITDQLNKKPHRRCFQIHIQLGYDRLARIGPVDIYQGQRGQDLGNPRDIFWMQ